MPILKAVLRATVITAVAAALFAGAYSGVRWPDEVEPRGV